MRKFLFQIINALLFGSDPLVSNIGDMLKHRAEARRHKKLSETLELKIQREKYFIEGHAAEYKAAKLLINKDLEQLF